ncbi:Nn.00g039060.m01.CDS01 [Neocucurbitaria sp. VM-36]
MAPTERPILFHYPPSIYSHRVLWYLWLRGIPYDECIQPPVMPRPDLAAINVGYRKIPIVAIGKDIYCDSRLIISKLESLYPDSPLAPSTLAEAGVRKLFENYTVDGGIFGNAVKVMPYWTDSGLLQNKVFLDDRQTLMGGRRMTAENMKAGRPDGLQNLRQAFDLLETTFLADGRDWILGTKEPSLADIDAVWPFEWLIVDRYMRECLPEASFNAKIYPKTYGWVKRFMDFVEKKKATHPKPATLDGGAMSQRVLRATSSVDYIASVEDDPLDVKSGDEVEVFPSDYGQMGKSAGTLIGLTTDEVVIRNTKGLHLHFPRWNFSIKKITQNRTNLPAAVSTNEVPKMRLIYHHFSPFTRKVFMLAHELGLAKYIDLQKVVVCPVPIAGWSDNNDEVSVYNPMAKIPCLVAEDVPDGIFDSRIICEYLSNLASVTPKKDARYWRLHTLHACADGIMDAAVLITYEVRIRKERNLYSEEWMEGQKQKILRGLDRFEVAAKEGLIPEPGAGPASADEVAIAVATAMTSQMVYLGIDWKQGRPKLEGWMKNWEQRQSFVTTPPEKDWTVDMNVKSVSKI